MRTVFLSLIGLAIIVGSGTVAVRFLPEPAPLCERCNVVIISLDALPKKDYALAAESVVFDRAYAQAPWTAPSVATWLTGTYPWEMHMWDVNDPIPTDEQTIAETLHAAGYATAGFSSGAFVLSYLNFDQGFTTWNDSLLMKQQHQPYNPVSESVAWIHQNQQEPFFLFVRPFELFDPYSDEVYGPTIQSVTNTHTDTLLAEYDAAFDVSEKILQTLYAELETAELLDHTILIVVGDNGVSLGEHGVYGFDSVGLYTEYSEAPFMVHVPKVSSKKIDATVELRSLAATVYDIVGIEQSPLSLTPLLIGTNTKDRVARSLTIFTPDLLETIADRYQKVADNIPTEKPTLSGEYDGSYSFSATQGNWHAIKNHDGSIELYNLESDPLQRKNMYTNVLRLLPSIPQEERATISEIIDEVEYGI